MKKNKDIYDFVSTKLFKKARVWGFNKTVLVLGLGMTAAITSFIVSSIVIPDNPETTNDISKGED